MVGSRVYLALFLSLMTAAGGEESSGKIPDVADYFENLNDDMTKLTWAHAVNSRALLEKALSDGDVMMLEADVVLGTVGGKNDTIPIMAHPPANESDLALKDFLTAVVDKQKSEKKGIKLDFKSIEAFEASLPVMDAIRTDLTFPVWLNADILKGPVESETAPVDAKRFLSQSAAKFPSSTLSLGWTTRYGPNITGEYTEKQLEDMRKAIEDEKIKQPVTLAVRAGIAANSRTGVTALVEKIDKFQEANRTSLTVWMSTDSDPVDVPELKTLILDLGRPRVFLDLPEQIRNQLQLDSSSGKASVSGIALAVLTSISAMFGSSFKL